MVASRRKAVKEPAPEPKNGKEKKKSEIVANASVGAKRKREVSPEPEAKPAKLTAAKVPDTPAALQDLALPFKVRALHVTLSFDILIADVFLTSV